MAVAASPDKTSFYGFGSGVDIPAQTIGCLSIISGNFFAGESSSGGGSPVPTGQINLFGENTCTFGLFFSSGVSNAVSLVMGSARRSFTASGTITVFTIGSGPEQVTFDFSVTATGDRENRSWGTNNVSDSGVRIVQNSDSFAKPAAAVLNVSGQIAGAPFSVRVNAPSSIGSQKIDTTVIGLPR
jgi:hypothetical protein